jgi:beta-lactamase superfamily II metal-dependent hydrolase
MNTQPTASDRLLVHSFAVGHGDCTLLEYLQADQVVFRLLCDAGTSAPAALLSHLDENRRSPSEPDIDLVILSHVDGDHQGGLHGLVGQAAIKIGEYWGPCLPAFRRHSWLFAPRVTQAVERASLLEQEIQAKGVPVVYPMEGFVATPIPGRVAISILSPPARLLRRLVSGDARETSELLTATPLPLEWLISGAPFDEDEGNVGLTDSMFISRSFVGPEDFPGALQAPYSMEKDAVVETARERAGDTWEPDLFGNSVLNDTSLVVAVDVLLDGRQRRRVLLPGDQENWAYIASKYPAGLGVDVLKAPHHGGRVYIADRAQSKDHAMDQVYLWMRPRSVLVSASGKHGLPHVHFRESLRSAGSALVCPNTRSFEPLTAGATAVQDRSCYVAYQCGSAPQRPHTTMTLSGEQESASATACVQGTLHRGAAPIVVLEQRLVEPDETFIRWTRTEVEKQANWVKRQLDEQHNEFTEAIRTATEPLLASMRQTPVTWETMEAAAKADGRHQLAADPSGVLRYGIARGLFWASDMPGRYAKGELYRRSTQAEVESVRTWLKSMPSILLYIENLNWDAVVGKNRMALLRSADRSTICALVAGKLRIPQAFAEAEVMPRIMADLAENFSARLCNASEPHNSPSRSRARSALLHLHGSASSVPDVVSAEWSEGLWSSYLAYEHNVEFVLSRAKSSMFIPSSLAKMNTASPHVSQTALSGFFKHSYYGISVDWQADFLPKAFEQAVWIPVWTNSTGAGDAVGS